MAIDPEDIRAMREQGDIKAFVLSLARPTHKPAVRTVEPPKPEIRISRPGAWPDGTRPPERRVHWTPAEIDAALDDFRQHSERGERP